MDNTNNNQQQEKKPKKMNYREMKNLLKNVGTEKTIRLYAKRSERDFGKARVEVAQKVFDRHLCGDDSDGNRSESESGIIDKALCEALWSKYFDMEDIKEIFSKVMCKVREERQSEIRTYLYELNISYPYNDYFIDSFYIAFPELRKREKLKQSESEKIVNERFGLLASAPLESAASKPVEENRANLPVVGSKEIAPKAEEPKKSRGGLMEEDKGIFKIIFSKRHLNKKEKYRAYNYAAMHAIFGVSSFFACLSTKDFWRLACHGQPEPIAAAKILAAMLLFFCIMPALYVYICYRFVFKYLRISNFKEKESFSFSFKRIWIALALAPVVYGISIPLGYVLAWPMKWVCAIIIAIFTVKVAIEYEKLNRRRY